MEILFTNECKPEMAASPSDAQDVSIFTETPRGSNTC